MKDVIAIVVVVVCLVAFGCLADVRGEARGRKLEKLEAIKAGVAEYRVNPQTGETQFVYKSKP